VSNTEHEYLTFMLDGEEFGVDILRVQEIKVWTPVTEIPDTPSYLKGVINLRGEIVPIVDLRQRFRRQPLEYSATTVVVVLRTETNGQNVVVGVVVDAVSDVYKMDDRDIKAAPDFGSTIDNRFIEGMATVGEKIVILLNTVKLLDVEELYSLTDAISVAS
jgi:purine-binding chemotaxis protein CheW